MFKDFTYCTWRIELEAEEYTLLPYYQGSMLRGSLGKALKELLCFKSYSTECSDCDAVSFCPYMKTFYHIKDTDIETDVNNTLYPHNAHEHVDKMGIQANGLLTNINTLPNPFVILPLENGRKELKAKDKYQFEFTIFGESNEYCLQYIYAFLKMASNGLTTAHKKFKLIKIEDIMTRVPIYQNGQLLSKNIKKQKFILNNDIDQINCVKLDFITPVRIKENGKFTTNITFELLIKNILRRLNMVYETYMDKPFNIDYKYYIELASKIQTTKIELKWAEVKRYSNHQNRQLSLSGALGTVTFKGDITPFIELLCIGTIIHVGKGCTSGDGYYEITIL